MNTLIHINSILVGWEDKFVDFLQDWQTLFGAIIGGVSGVIAALVVDFGARRREERSAAMLIVNDLKQVSTVCEILEDETKDLSAVDAALAAISYLGELHPKISPLTEGSIFRISNVDFNLSVHLVNFHRDYLLTIDLIKKEKNFRATSEYNTVEGASRHLSQCKMLYKTFKSISKHAVCAEKLINDFILGKRRRVIVNTIKRSFKLYKYGSDCEYLRTVGEPKEASEQAVLEGEV